MRHYNEKFNISSWNKESKQDVGVKILLFILSPVLGLIYSLRSLNTKSSYRIVFLFCLVFGMSFTVPDVRTEMSMDGISYRIDFEQYSTISTKDFKEILINYFKFDDGEKDIYFCTIAYVVSRFTQNYHILFFIFAAVFAFFQLKSLRYLTNSDRYDFSLLCFIITFFFLFNQIYNINGARFWTASWIAVYSCFKIFKEEKYRFIFLLFLTPFFHGSFVFMLGVVLLSLCTKKYINFWTTFFLFSIFFSSISVNLIQKHLDILPSFLSHMAAAYVDEDYLLQRNVGTGFYWVRLLFDGLLGVYINILIICLITVRKKILRTDDKALYQFTLVFMSVVNFVMAVPSLGVRFREVGFSFLAFLWLNHLARRKYDLIMYVLPIVFFMRIFYLTKDYLSVLSIDFLMSPLYSFIKYIFI